MPRTRVSSGAPWEPVVGYSRAVRAGSMVFVSGTTSVGPDGAVVGPGDPYHQTVEALSIIARALRDAGARLEDVVRTRMFVTDISRFDEYARAHGEIFGRIRPAATCVEVRALVRPEFLIEIEVDAIVPAAARRRRTPARRAPTARKGLPRGGPLAGKTFR